MAERIREVAEKRVGREALGEHGDIAAEELDAPEAGKEQRSP
jgi:hypothetical protein